MQGQRNSVSTLPENLSFDHGSTSSDAGMDSQVPWNNMQNSAEARLPEYKIASSDPDTQYSHHIAHSQWSLGETSSGAARSQSDRSERKREHRWSVPSRAALDLEECQLESSNILPLDNVVVDGQGNQTSSGSSLLQIPGPDSISQDLNMCSEFGDQEYDDCQVIEHPNRHISVGSSNEKMPSTGSSSDTLGMSSGCGGYVMEDSDYRPGRSLDGRRLSCKRKALDVQVGQSSGAGSSNCFEHAERSQWHDVTSAPAQISASTVSMSTPPANNLVFSNGSEHGNSRIRLELGEAVSSNPLSSNSRETAGSSRRNFRLRISGSHQQDHIPGIPLPREANVSNSRHSSRLVLRNRLFDLNPNPPVENGNLHGQSILQHIPSVRRNPHSRWSGASSSRTSNSSSAAVSLERETDPMLYEESTSGNIPRSMSEHPMFIPASEMGGSFQQPPNWNLAGGINNIAGNAVSASRAGSTSGINSSLPSPSWSHRSYPQYPRRLTEIVRRSLLSAAGTEPGGQSSSTAIRSSAPSTSQETALPSGSSNHASHLANTRSALLERHLDSPFALHGSLRSMAATREGRGSVMSEIRHVLDLMRRGEGLRLEDMMMLDHNVFFGMGDIHDRHRDMRLDVDNMSYEELLALEERIGNVSTGLNEETIMARLKQRKYAERRADQAETEPCSICREEYNDGEDLGTLECGHDFHRDCVKQWLMQKNSCPICKTAGLST
ncbi:probable E3 ubiquitin-protein ligase RHG1A isoform X2 [Salvia miltiorrhiza]|uniref:probable E3 ubiquitin-protein ligase RHG1A isoform X2 n=1 Tax=Salvia miltiorrhiza TaxID=226208 RepID=UPI0025AB7CA6|nr:probable E3 ubiquitin-protein ligase RHG1A isoform X2 [Salvia miltiorrhiza]XP_057779853.1 probable E3 ubiquitin-protein ligase RHG1A isoform X2 [Salvia miltiorrhiza]XP_057779858.1 probable E3 ubiquitin-protein ligase RHG1A isoform X2 [Salvia miltiorrhiza]XP_057779861.1 probable E3 ubiquitin-protein ligase RHG1A isoform X2 [Salvia miltiorrhiza]XP_057779865.1 probable E3 ubiquitin-protein ligase RHG1A isoform X2 [Salvia miltiorrhiza]